MQPHAIVTTGSSTFYLHLNVEVNIATAIANGEALTKLGVTVAESKGKCYVQLTKVEGLIENTPGFAELIVRALRHCLTEWQKSYMYELDWATDGRFAIDPELYDILPSILLDFVEIDDDMLFFSSKGVAHFTPTVSLYQVRMV